MGVGQVGDGVEVRGTHVAAPSVAHRRVGWKARVKAAAGWVADRELWFLVAVVPLLMFSEFLPEPLAGIGLLLIPVLWLCRWMAKGYLTVQ